VLRVFAILFFAVFAGVAQAECNNLTQAELRGIRDEMESLARRLDQLSARANYQELREMDLTPEVAATLPVMPESPAELAIEVDADGLPMVNCDDNGDAIDEVAALLAVLVEQIAALDAFEAALSAREESLTSAELVVADAPPAEAPPADEPPAMADATTPEATEPDETGADTAATPDASASDDTDADVAANPDETAESSATDEASPVALREPLPDPDNPFLFRRVITLPDAGMLTSAGSAEQGVVLPVFSVLYVFAESQANGTAWLEVGASLREDAQGWVRTDQVLPWSSMLVMQFAPRGQRSEVLFFEDDTPLSLMLNDPFSREEARAIHAALAAERQALAADPSYVPQWPQNLVAVEPAGAVSFGDRPYLLPILDWKSELIDGFTETTLLEVAAVPADAGGGTIAERDEGSMAVDANQLAALDGDFRVGVVFVIDTSVSMAPFIERTYQTVQSFYDAFSEIETASLVSYGLVGFRDNVDLDPEALEYVTRVFQPLDPAAPPAQVLTNLEQVNEAAASNLEFKEDGFAGVQVAIEQMDWSPFDARLIVLVTDASSREGDDPLAAFSGLTSEVLSERARSMGIVILPLHLLTPAGAQSQDHAAAEDQYMRLSATGDVSVSKYFSFDATDATNFGLSLQTMARQIVRDVTTAAGGQLINQDATAGLDLELGLDVGSASTPEEDAADLAAVVSNELFRAQLESLGRVEGGVAPAFLSGWAADLDLNDPTITTLEVSVFLTRNQLSTLDKQLDLIVSAFRDGGADPETFFDNLQLLAASMATDPDAVRNDDRLAVQTIMPAFLANLPYRSQVMNLNRDRWSGLSVSDRQLFIEAIEAKRAIYQNIFDQTDLWIDFGAGDPGLEATPVRLNNLP
jgi:serine/threonine-protein kinase PpkA